MNEKVSKVMSSLESNNIKAVYVQTKAEVCEIVKDMLFDGAVITAGGSMSLKESGVWDIINSPEYDFRDRSKQGITEEERTKAYKAAIGCDFFFCSTNAVTENGELVNVDGNANRISSIAFGPKKVVMVVGVNKIVKDIDEGFLRIKKIAAPKNAVRLNTGTPCQKLGHCVALEKSNCPAVTDGCKNLNRMCIEYLVLGFQKQKDRITVILCGETLGY